MTDTIVQNRSSAVNGLLGGDNIQLSNKAPTTVSSPASSASSSNPSPTLLTNGDEEGVGSGFNSACPSPKSDKDTSTNDNQTEEQSQQSSPQPPSSTPSPPTPNSPRQLSAAFEELRRENERLYAELANTQEVLDLFEDHRALLREQMSMCICSGRDYHLQRFRLAEDAYRRVMPIRRLIEPEQLLKASGAAGAVEQYSDSVLSIIDSASTLAASLHFPGLGKGPSSNNQLLKGRRGGNNGTGAILTAKRPPGKEVICSAVSNNSPKSRVRAFLDGKGGSSSSSSLTRQILLQPQQQSIVASVPLNLVNGNSHNSSQLNLKGGGQIIIRKRILPQDQLGSSNDNQDGGLRQQQLMMKKAKAGGGNASNGGQKYTILTTSNKTFSGLVNASSNQQQQQQRVILNRRPQVNQQQRVINGNGQPNRNSLQSQNSAEDEEDVERLDQLNDALDQLLMGRYDALNSIGQPSLGRNSNNVRQQENQEDYDEEEAEEQGENHERNGEDDEDIIFLDEVKNQNPPGGPSTRNIAVQLKPKIVIARQGQQGSSSATPSASILGAALESGYKPYPSNYHQITSGGAKSGSSNSVGNMVMNQSTLRLFAGPNTSLSGNGSGNSGSNNNITVINNKHLFQQQQQNKRPHLTNEERTDIINRLKSNESGARIARDYGITKQAVSAIKRRAQLMGDNFVHNFTAANFQQQQQQSNFEMPTFNLSSNMSSPVNLVNRNGRIPSPLNGSRRGNGSGGQLTEKQKMMNMINSASAGQLRNQSSSSLCLPINPVAILKSQMARNASSSSSSTSSTPNSRASSFNLTNVNSLPSARLKLDSKRLLLPRLLQGTETYQTYASTSKTPSETEEANHRSGESLEVKEEEDEEGEDGGGDEEEEDAVGEEEQYSMEEENIIYQENNDEDEEEEGDYEEQQPPQVPVSRSGKPFSFSMRQAMLDGQEEDEEEENQEEEEPEEEEMYYNPSDDAPPEASDDNEGLLMNEHELAMMAGSMGHEGGDDGMDEEEEEVDFDGHDPQFDTSGLGMEDEDEEVEIPSDDAEVLRQSNGLDDFDDGNGGGLLGDDINNNPEDDDDHHHHMQLDQLYSTEDGGDGLVDESIDPQLGNEFEQYVDSESLLM